jgi:hypothetical protein
MSHHRRNTSALLAVLMLGSLVPATLAQSTREHRLPISWSRFYDYDGIVDLCRQIAGEWPELCRLEFIGTSHEGRALPLLTISNPATGSEASKPAMWIDGNVHGNEVQGSEAALYTAWLLLERNGELDAITSLVDEAVFYIFPMVNPDGRQFWFDAPNTASSSRSGKRPFDNDRDGRVDEDGPDDLDGDGELLRMRKRVEVGTGDYILDPDDPRIMVRVSREDRVKLGADWVMFGGEGYDNDGDGRVNEDGPGGYDMNRNWPAGWMPRYVQYGAGDYPFSFPETAAVGSFISQHPNIAAVQSFHNSGGMMLRGPGTDSRTDYYPSADRSVYRAIGEDGERILPFYDYLVIYDDLYEVHGGFVDWTAETLGIISFTNELWAGDQYFGGSDTDLDRNQQRLFFDDHLMFGETWVDWHEVPHPDYGTVEVGGYRKMTGRTPPAFMIEEMLHRNAAFCIFHAQQMPKLELVSLDVADAGGGASYITVEIRNTRWIPTRTAVSALKGVGRPDIVTIAGDDLVVVAGGTGASRFDLASFNAVEHEPERLKLDGGIPGHGSIRLRWVVAGSGPFTVTIDAEKVVDLVVEGVL